MSSVNQKAGLGSDLYPSRGGRKASILDRRDPVVYSPFDVNGPLTQKQYEDYKAQGFLVVDNVFTDKEIDCFQGELERLRADDTIGERKETISEPDSGDVRSIFKVHEISTIFKALSTDVRLVNLAEYILNDKVYIHQSRLNYKPGFRGKEFYWHSDFETWHVEDGMPAMRALSMSITLTENNENNGPLMLIPGSHRRYVVCEGETPEKHFEASLKKQEYGVPSDQSLQQLVNEGGIVSAKTRPGSVILFDCNTMHGSNGNITPIPRSNVFFVFNSFSNRVVDPFCKQPPRPEFICNRNCIVPIKPKKFYPIHE